MIERLRRLLWPKKIRHPRLCRPEYVGRHKGETFLVLGSGPSIASHRRTISRFMEQNRPIVLAANFPPVDLPVHYVGFCNRLRFCSYGSRAIALARIGLLIDPHIPDRVATRVLGGGLRWEAMPYKSERRPFDVSSGIVQCDCGQTGALLLAVAYIMGASEVWAAGFDGYDDPSQHHWYPEPDFPVARLRQLEARVKVVLPQMREYFKAHGVGGPWLLTPSKAYPEFYRGI